MILRILHVTHWIFRPPSLSKALLLFICAVFIQGCANTDYQELLSYSPKEKVFYAEFGQVWRATQLALRKYPIKVNNIDKGLLESEVIKGFDTWLPPFQNKRSGGLRYRLLVRVIKGKVKGQSAIKVLVFKKSWIQSDFFADQKEQASDGLEEESILYRIDRELKIDRALKRAQTLKNN